MNEKEFASVFSVHLHEILNCGGLINGERVGFETAISAIYNRGLQPATRGPPAALGRVLCGPGRVFHKIQCVMSIEA